MKNTAKQFQATPARSEPRDSVRLPTDRAFVLQFRADTDLKHRHFDGRIEHLVSGHVGLFHSLEELVEFLEQTLPSDQ